MSQTQLETDIQGLQTRRSEIARQLADVQADEQSAREAVIGGAPAVELQTARAQLTTLQDVADELDRRIQDKANQLQAQYDAQAHTEAVAHVKEVAAMWTANRAQVLEKGQVLVAQVTAFLPYLLELSHLADERLTVVELARSSGVGADEIDFSFEIENAHSLFAPLVAGASEADHAGLWLIFQHYSRFAAIAENVHRFHRHDAQSEEVTSNADGILNGIFTGLESLKANCEARSRSLTAIKEAPDAETKVQLLVEHSKRFRPVPFISQEGGTS